MAKTDEVKSTPPEDLDLLLPPEVTGLRPAVVAGAERPRNSAGCAWRPCA